MNSPRSMKLSGKYTSKFTKLTQSSWQRSEKFLDLDQMEQLKLAYMSYMSNTFLLHTVAIGPATKVYFNIPSKLVQYQCGILLNRKPLF